MKPVHSFQTLSTYCHRSRKVVLVKCRVKHTSVSW